MLRPILNLVFRVVIVLMFILMPGCKARKEKQTIGVILATSGPADFIGKPERDVLKLMMEEYNTNETNTYGIELVILDSESKPDRARALFDSFVENERVIAIIGPSTSGESIPLAREAFKKRISLLSLAASKKIVELEEGQTNPWAFKFAQNDDLAATRLAGTISRAGNVKIAFLYSNDGFGKSGSEVFQAAVKDWPIEIVHLASFPPGLDVPETYVDAIPTNASAIVIWGTAGPAELVKEIRRRGHMASIYLSHGNASDSFIKSAGTAAEGVVIVGSRLLTDDIKFDENDPADLAILQYRKFWKTHFSGVPSHFGGHARDALKAVMNVLPQVDLLQDAAHVRSDIGNALEKLNPYYGVTGVFRFNTNDHAGLGLDAFATYKVENGKFVLFTK